MLLASLFVVILLAALPSEVQSTCCRLPFTNGECRVNRQGPHRYQIMPNRRFGLVKESTECTINDFDSTYRKVVEQNNPCNDCPGLLVLHANSSEIFLFPEYLDRILEGRTNLQLKNVVILTTSLVGAYDLDFTLFAKHYAGRPVDEVPSIYVDLQLPPINTSLAVQPTLRLRLPSSNDGRDGFSKISRQELISPVDIDKQSMDNVHQLPYIYNFDLAKHHSSSSCNLHEVHVSPSSLVWKRLDSEDAACHHFMPYFGLNPCYATGFTRLFCPIVQSITNEDALRLSAYVPSQKDLEHLTLAVTGGREVELSLSNAQMRPAEHVKILLLQGHLVVTDINLDLHIRVEFGGNCDDFSLTVPSGFSATRYRQFDSETLGIKEGDYFIDLPHCFRLIKNFVAKPIPLANNVSDLVDSESSESQSNSTSEHQQSATVNFWNFWRNNKDLIYWFIALLILLALIPLCLGLFYRAYCNSKRRSSWTLNQPAQTNPAYRASKDERTDLSVVSFADSSTQTKDKPIRI